MQVSWTSILKGETSNPGLLCNYATDDPYNIALGLLLQCSIPTSLMITSYVTWSL